MAAARTGLVNALLEKSQATEWHDAIREWRVDEIIETPADVYCPCGQRIRRMYWIDNDTTDQRMFVGKDCIRKFGGAELNDQRKAKERRHTHKCCDSCKKETSVATGRRYVMYKESAGAEVSLYFCKRCHTRRKCLVCEHLRAVGEGTTTPAIIVDSEVVCSACCTVRGDIDQCRNEECGQPFFKEPREDLLDEMTTLCQRCMTADVATELEQYERAEGSGAPVCEVCLKEKVNMTRFGVPFKRCWNCRAVSRWMCHYRGCQKSIGRVGWAKGYRRCYVHNQHLRR